MEYCDAGSHPTLNAFEYGGKRWCPQHPPPPGEQERDPGFCEWARGHWADDTVYVPRLARRWCKAHFGGWVREVARRGTWTG